MHLGPLVRQGEQVAEAAARAAKGNMHIQKKTLRRLLPPERLQRNWRIKVAVSGFVRIGI
ncbi:hypothetical protein D3C85_1828530 [compost metagenome]